MLGTTFPVKVRSGSPRRLGEGEGGEVSLSGARAFMNGEKGFALGRYRDWISYGWAAKRRPTNESNNVGSPDAATTSRIFASGVSTVRDIGMRCRAQDAGCSIIVDTCSQPRL